jgi:hypothetical protein
VISNETERLEFVLAVRMYITIDETKNKLCTKQTIADQSQVAETKPEAKN